MRYIHMSRHHVMMMMMFYSSEDCQVITLCDVCFTIVTKNCYKYCNMLNREMFNLSDP